VRARSAASGHTWVGGWLHAGRLSGSGSPNSPGRPLRTGHIQAPH
jgi:hypothetical protein